MMRKVGVVCVLAVLSVFIIVTIYSVANSASQPAATRAALASNMSATPLPANRQPTTVSIVPLQVVMPSLASTHVKIGLIALATVCVSFALWALFRPST